MILNSLQEAQESSYGKSNRGITWDSETYSVSSEQRVIGVRESVSQKLAAFVLATYPEARDGKLCSFLEDNPGIWNNFWLSEVGQELEQYLIEKWGDRWNEGFREDQLPPKTDYIIEASEEDA